MSSAYFRIYFDGKFNFSIIIILSKVILLGFLLFVYVNNKLDGFWVVKICYFCLLSISKETLEMGLKSKDHVDTQLEASLASFSSN